MDIICTCIQKLNPSKGFFRFAQNALVSEPLEGFGYLKGFTCSYLFILYYYLF